ncbi:MAG: M28 family metallopeptidase [Chitinophagaceae bacterium]
MRKIAILFPVLFLAVLTYSQNDAPDLNIVNKIRQEGMQNSKVMEIAFYLTDVSGPRLTASPGYLNAANWAKNKLTSLGLSNAVVEPWGEFGKGWQQERSYVAMTKPYYQPFIAIPKAWTKGTPGNSTMNGEVILITAKDSAGLKQYEGKLNNKIVMTWNADTLKPSFRADGRRWEDTTLEKMAAAVPQENTARGGRGNQSPEWMAMQAFNRTLNALMLKEKPALILSMNPRGNNGTLFVSSGGQYQKDAPEAPASVVISSDEYLKLQRLINAGIKVELEADVKTRFFTADLKGYNVIAEIPGTDPVLKNEVVMLGSHLDSWHGSTGATDNASGCAVMMEAVRILQALNIKPRRTIRIALWGGEEQGLHGSRNYVKNHIGDPATMEIKPAHEKISAYYNLDNGTGRIRGVYLQGNAGVSPIFSKWLEPFKDLDAKTVTISNTGGTDHLSFDAVGIPGFQFIQDPIEYSTRTHHTNMDSYDHLIPEDLKQASVIVASFVYHSAMRDEKLPRKELPKARN